MAALAFVAPAHADTTVVIRGSAFPLGSGLAHVGCTGIYDAGAGPIQPYVARGPGAAPLGERSLGFDLAGGDAAGPVRYTASMAATTTVSLSGVAPQGTTGVAWAGYQEPGQEGSGRVWFGRAPLSLPAGGWTSVEVSDLSYEWAEYDTTTREIIAAGPRASVAAFAAAHGRSGAGLWTVAFGCDGAPFQLDALRFGDAAGTTTYDLEGLATRLSIHGDATRVDAGESVRIEGTLGVSGGADIPRATALLERRSVDTDGWETLRVIDVAGGLSTSVTPPTRTEYRWRFADRPLAEGSTSAIFTVDVAPVVQARLGDDGRTVVGTASPGRVGLAVTLRRTDGSGPVRSTTTGTGGAFRLPLDGVASGRYAVSVVAVGSDLVGTSDPLTIEGEPSPSSPSAEPASPSPTSRATQTPSPDPSPSPEPTPSSEPSPVTRPSDTPTPSSPAPSVSTGPEQTPSDAPDTGAAQSLSASTEPSTTAGP